MRRFFHPAAAAAVVYSLLTVALTWPLIVRPGSVVPNDLGDPLLNTWILAWNARVAPLTTAWWNGPQFYPIAGTMAFSEHLLGLSILATPIIRLTGDPLVAYNVVFFLSFVLSALAAYWLAFTISRRHDCAFLAGLAFGFAPYRMAQFPHIQVLSAYWMPVALAALHRYVEDRRPRWAALFAVAWLMQVLVCGYYLFYLTILVGLWLPWFLTGPGRLRTLSRLGAAWAIVSIPLVPILYGYWHFQHAYGLRRGVDEITSFSADVASLLKAPSNLLLWGWLNVVKHPEAEIFPGLTIVVLVVLGAVIGLSSLPKKQTGRMRIARACVLLALLLFAVAASPFVVGSWRLEIGGVRLLSVGRPHKPLSIGLWLLAIAGTMHPSVRTVWRRRSAMTFYALAASVMWLLSLGPAPTFLDKPFLYKAPYAWLMLLPGGDGIRVPARFWMLAALCLSIAAALALRQITARWPRYARAIAAVACLGALIDGWPAPMVMERRPEDRPNHTQAVARLDLPHGPTHDLLALFRATAHHRPLFNGYSGYFPPHYWLTHYLVNQHNPALLAHLSSYGPIEVVIDHDEDPAAELRNFVLNAPQSSLVYSDKHYSAFRVEPGPAVARLPKLRGQPLPIQSMSAEFNAELLGAMIDHNIVTRWHCGRDQRPGDSFTVDLGAVRQVDGAELMIGGYVDDFPRQLLIETSVDGATWSTAWTGDAPVVALLGALEDPLNIPMPFQFERKPARYVRFTELGADKTFYWSVAEMRIVGE